MGNFEAFAAHNRPARIPRSALLGSIGPNARNAPRDMHVITRTLASAGLLNETACPAQTYEVIFNAIRHVGRTLTVTGTSRVDGTISPGDETELAVRSALAKGRLPLSHRAVVDSRFPKGARTLIDGGMKRALARLSNAPTGPLNASPQRRALLPVVSPETFLANRRLADALASGGSMPGLDAVVAETFCNGGKQAFSDVKDFFRTLEQRAPETAIALSANVERRLKGSALKLFRKLRYGEPPDEGDFKPLPQRCLS